MSKPEWIVTIHEDQRPFPISFQDIFAQKDVIQSMMLLWDYNSYYVNIPKRYLIINGGRKVTPTGLTQMTDARICYTRRIQSTIGVNCEVAKELKQSVSYLLGFEGTLNEEKREILLHISEDGSMWAWKDKR